MLSRQGTFILFAITIVFLLVVPACVQHGMFMDGLQYAIVSKNLAWEKGSFWLPYLNSSWNRMGENAFLEHPPLSYFLQAVFFKILGPGVFTEKIYGVCMAILCAFLIFKTWRLIFTEHPVYAKYWWLAVLLWFVTPSVFWSFRNNMIENTVSVFVLAAGFFALKAVLGKKFGLHLLLMAGLMIFCGSLCKGIPALFPLSIVFCFYLCTKRISLKRAVVSTLVLIATPVLIYTLIVTLNEEARYSLGFYIKSRLLERLDSEPTVDNRFTIIWWLITDEFVNIGVFLTMTLIFGFRSFRGKLNAGNRNWISFFVVYGLCGVVPLSLTHVQRATYFVPALPFFAMALSVFLSARTHELINFMSERVFRIIRAIVVVFAALLLIVAFVMAGNDSRDEILLSDVRKIGAATGDEKIIATNKDTYLQWDFQFYLLRYFDATLKVDTENQQKYLVFKKESAPPLPPGYRQTDLGLANYIVYEKITG